MIIVNSPIVSILTPTYNRASKLKNLYNSLCSQSDQHFVWIVVDDGSDDNTESIVGEFIQNNKISVTYIKKDNGGKHTALNVGISISSTPLTFIVDSDDILTADAIEYIRSFYSLYKDDNEVCGFSFLRAFPDGAINGKPFAVNEWKESYINARVNANDMKSDKAEVYKTDCLKEFKFPEFAGEKFLGEDIAWIRMARKYKTIHINKVIYIGDYQADGLTKNRRKHNMNSPRGCTARAKEYMIKDICFNQRIKGTLQYLIYGRVAGINYRQLFSEAPNKSLCIVLTIPAFFIQKYWRLQNRSTE